MERKFRIELILKEFARLWYVLLAIVVVCIAIGGMYSAFIAEAEYTATASVSIQMTTGETGEGVIDRLNNAKANLKTDVISAGLVADLNKKVSELKGGKQLKDSDFGKIYEIKSDSNTYSITAKFDNEDDSVALATFFKDNVIERVNTAKSAEEYGKYNITPTVSAAPAITADDEPAPIWLTMLIGAVLGVIIHAVVSLFVYYTNKKFYDAEEFRDTFIIPLIEDNFAEKGFSDAAIMLSRRRVEGVPFVVALGDGFDTAKVAGGFASLGCRVAVGGADEIAAGANVSFDGEVISKLVVSDGAGKLMDVKNAVLEFKEKFKGKIDILIAVASPESLRKDLFILSDAADATVVKVDIGSMKKKDIAELFENLKSSDENKYVAAVI